MNLKSETIGFAAGNAPSHLDGGHFTIKSVVFVVLALWFGLVSFLGAQGAFVARPGSPPLAIFLGVAIPLVLFFTAYFRSAAFRAFVLGADMRFVAALQGWRWAGLGFLTLYAKGILPGLFAFPAGLGDMAIGFTAPWMVLRLARQPQFAASRRFVTWNILGIVDFVGAITMGTLCSGFVPAINGLTGNVNTGPMSQLPLILIPAYMVPIFIMLHFTALAQARQRSWK